MLDQTTLRKDYLLYLFKHHVSRGEKKIDLNLNFSKASRESISYRKRKQARSNMEMMMGTDEQTSAQVLEAQAHHIWRQTFSFINSASLKCAIELGIPDIVHRHGKPMTVPELVAELPIEPAKSRCIQALMRLLAHSGFFMKSNLTQDSNQEGFSLKPASRLLLKDEPLNATAFVQIVLDPIVTAPWHFLSNWFKNDDDSQTTFAATHGMTFWEYNAMDRRIGNLFNEAMAGDSRLITEVLVKDCKAVFKGLSSLVDVGGGTGTVSRAIAETFPDLKCTVFDLPHVVANLQGSENLEFVGGDMFVDIPPADAILLKWILHNWSDEECVKILKKCKESLVTDKDEAKLIIIDINLDNDDLQRAANGAQILYDMEMMILLRGKERNEREWAQLFKEAGFSRYNISPELGLRSIIEVYP